jgi:hypothetical protein
MTKSQHSLPWSSFGLRHEVWLGERVSGVFISARQRPPADGPENRGPISNGPLRVALLTTPDAQPLDVAGPHEIFSLAGRKLHELGDVNGRGYTVELLKIGKGRVITGGSGLSLLAKHS